MDLQVTKGKRGRPKGSKNKSKNDGDKTSILHKSVGSLEDNSSMEQSVLSQMQSFRNSILEHLKVELFGEGNGSVLPTPPMNLSTLLSPTDTHLESTNSSIHSSSTKMVSNLGLKALATERSNNDSNALNKSVAEIQPRKRGRPRLSEAQKKNKNKNLSFESEKSNHVQDTTVTTFVNRPLSEAETNKELPSFNHISSSQNKQPNIKKNITDQSNKDCNDVSSKTPERPSQCLTSPEEQNLNIEKEPNEMCRLPPKIMAVEEVLQGLRLSPTNISCQLKEGEDGSILAQIFTKDCMRSSLKASMRSKILNSDKVLSSFSSFCRRRMIKKTMQRNESEILLGNLSGRDTTAPVKKNSFILNRVGSSSILEKENIMRVNNDNSKIMNDATSRHGRSLTRDKLIVAESPKLRSAGVQCNERKNAVSVKSQTNFTSYKDASIQTDADLRESRTADVSVQATSFSDSSLCSKCHCTLEGPAKEYGSIRCEIPPKPTPLLSSSFLNNLNLTNGLIGNPSVLGDTAGNKDVTFNLRSSFFDSTFLNELVIGTPASKVSQECHSVASKTNSNRIVCFPEHIGIPSSEGINGKLLSANFLDQNKDHTDSLILETTSMIMESAGAAPESTTQKEKVDLLDADDVIIRGNIALSTNSGDSISNEQSNVGTFLDEGFINEPSADAQLIDQSLRTEQDEKSVEVLHFHNSRIDGRSRKRKRSTDADDDTDDFVLRKQSKRICSLPDESHGKRYASQKIHNERKYRDCKRFVEEKAKLKSPVYKKIRRCTYVDAKPICKDYEPTSCDCKVARPDDAKEICCGDSCLNRLVYAECHPSTCPTGDKCSNRRIQKKQWVEGLIKFQTKDRGYGVKTLKSLRPGQFVIEYCGEVVSENEFKRRMSQNYCNERHHYCLNLDSGMVIDGYRMGNISRFINHSCKPNCVMEKWNVNGVYRMGLFASDAIKSGDELTYDYNFHSYNIRSQQICKCGSENCRGMMAGKNQKMKKNEKSKQTSLKKHSLRKVRPGYLKNSPASLRPATANVRASSATASSLSSKTASSTKERIFAQKQRLFLQRNVRKVKKMRSNSKAVKLNSLGFHHPNRREGGIAKDYGCFLKSLPGFENMFSFTKKPCFRVPNDKAKESTLKHIFTTIINTLSDIDANSLYASRPSLQGLTLPKDPIFVETAQEPLSLEAILNNVHLSHYTSFQDFNEDVDKLFDRIQKREVFNADVEDALLDVKRVYKEASKDVISLYSDIVLKPLAPLHSRMPPVQGIKPASEEQPLEVDMSNNSFSADSRDAEDTEVEVIRCVCNIYKDEGLMIQCEKCEKWQHCVCMNVKGDEDHYTCELCSPRTISKEVLLVPQPEDALAHCRYYMTLMRDERLQVRVGECVYVTREGSTIDIVTFNNQRSSHLIRDQLDIFRVERLWRKYSGDGFAFGHYYMRPHETFHEPNRKFYPNEVFRAPLYHVVPLEAIVGTCCVMDPVTYCKGHPLGIKTEDIYVCEFRVDKAARLFSKINKSQHMTNTNSYCFHHYPTKLKPKRTYMVHQESDGGGSTGQS